MSYVYIRSEAPSRDNNFNPLYTVGFYDPEGQWRPESDHPSSDAAADRVHWLNGGQQRDDGK